MNKVFWLGAGASAGSEVDPSGSDRRPPTIKQFFQAGRSLGLNRDDYFSPLFDFMQRRWGIGEEPLVSENAASSIETILSLFETERQFYPLDQERLQDRAYRDDRYAFERSYELLRNYIREALLGSNAVPHPRQGCSLHFAIASHLDPSDAVINFNYCLIMDKALKDTGRWNEWVGYAPMTFNKIYHVGHWYDQPQMSSASELTYLKPHGSINWFASTGKRFTLISKDEHRYENDSSHPQRRVISLWSSHTVNLRQAEDIFEGQCVEQLLVPPIVHKDYKSFRSIWLKAEEVLSTAKELVIIGFSFAPADVQAEWLLRRGLAENHNAVSVTLVDPNNEVRERIRSLIASINGRHRVQNEYRSLKDFVSATYGSDRYENAKEQIST